MIMIKFYFFFLKTNGYQFISYLLKQGKAKKSHVECVITFQKRKRRKAVVRS